MRARAGLLLAVLALLAAVAAGGGPPGAPGTAAARAQDAPGGQPQHLDPAWLASIDDAQLHGTVTPPGADARHATAEIAAYDDLVQGYPSLTEDELRTRYFKDRRFGAVDDPERTYTPRDGVTVVRDARWGEPHIFGETDEDMAFGAGFVAVEDRAPIMEVLRAVGRAEAFQLLGTAPAWMADAEMVRMYGYTEDEWQAQIDRLPAVYGDAGRDVVAILEAYVEGINAYYHGAARGELPLPAGLSDLGVGIPGPWTSKDVVAVVSAVRSLFGAGGGAEMSNAAVLAGLVEDFGADGGRRVYDDFRNRFNADGPVHTTGSFPYHHRDPARLDPAANVFSYTGGATGIQSRLEELFGGSAQLAAAQLGALAEEARIKWERLVYPTPAGVVDLSRPGSMSNYLVVDRRRSSTGHPILLGGPQAGYFSPQILMDYELHSPTIHARGSGFPGLNVLVVIGRTQSYAWTPTAGGSDMIDTYVVELCDPSGGPATEQSRHYRHGGECVEMDRRVIREAAALPIDLPGRNLLPDIVAERTVHGPVVARGVVGDMPVAVATKRSTYLKELDAAVSILKMNRNEASTADAFVDIFHESHNLSTNWAYVNDREIGYVHGGLYPIRPASVDPDFPVWGSGEWEWQTDAAGRDVYVDRSRRPHEVNPARGYTVSWNNRPAHDWGSSDQQWGHSALYRASLLEDAILAQPAGSIDPVRLVQLMEEAGLTDLRGRYVLPLALRVLAATPAPSTREAQMAALLTDWAAARALRRDGDGDGDYEHSAAVAIMDAWWERMIRAVYDPVIGDAARIPITFDNAPSSIGSAYQDGFYGYVWTDLSMALGDSVRSPTSQVHCGGSPGVSGSAAACAERLWASLVAAGDALAASQGSDDPAAWLADAEGERIRFLPAAVLSMHWVNRPTTQQIAMFGALAPPAQAPAPTPTASPSPTPEAAPTPSSRLPATGGGAAVGLGALTALLALMLARPGRRRGAPPGPRGV